MKIIGLTGPIGSGKSYVADIFKEHGIPSIDTDKVYHELISNYTETVKELENAFGSGIVNAQGGIDRKALSEIVFSDRKKLELLNEITHKYVKSSTLRMIEDKRDQGFRAVIVEVPLMFESGFDKLCDTVICVAADEGVRIERIMKRNGISEEEAKKRLKNQKDIEFYIANSSKVVYNNNYNDVRAQVDALINEIFT